MEGLIFRLQGDDRTEEVTVNSAGVLVTDPKLLLTITE